MLFQKRHKKTMRIIWWVLSVLIILSMLLLFGPISPYATPSQPVNSENEPDTSSQANIDSEGQDLDDFEATLQF